jgi:crotonobetainyl-CoA:carnitine CoA-transferase CaiB-like acyl-CoA transferase
MQFNRGKEGIVLDTKTSEGVNVLKHILFTADVYVQNFRPGTMDKMGLGYDDVNTLNEDLIYCSISGFGKDGPYSKRMAFDAVLQPMTGFPVMQGAANGENAPPQLINGYQVDKLTAWNAVQAILAALFARSSGKSRGQHVEVAMLDVGLNFFFPDGERCEHWPPPHRLAL